MSATLGAMRHRGPNDQAHRRWRTPDDRHVDLLHARLSIIDLDPRSNQPFHVGSRWMTYNGELYNYRELRAGLDGLRTASDTEVLLAVIERDGWAALDACEGMWALAVYDERNGELVLSRDRFGEKPLHLYRGADGLYFGSEPKLIHAMLGHRLPINPRHLQRYLVNGYKSLHKSRDTFFEGIEELPPGTLLRVGAGGAERSERYWGAGPVPEDQAMSFEAAVAGTRERLLRAVELRLRADVPLAFCMSGGVDSLSLIAIAQRVFGYDVHGFTIMNSDSRYEESEMVACAVDELGVRHTPIALDTTDFLPRLRRLVHQHDAPVLTISYYVHWLLMQAIHEHGYRVSVSGTAADELFSGYYDHHLAYLAVTQSLAARRAWEEHVRPVVRNPHLADAELFTRDPAFRDHIYLNADSFAARLRAPFRERFTEREYPSTNLLRKRMLNELFDEAVPVILHEDDLNAMSFSIENRSPFLDRALYDFSLTIPTRHLIRDGRAKAVLREAMRGIAPQRVLDNRRKVGFNAPIHALLDTSDPEVRGELLADSPIFDHVRREAIAALLDREELPNSESKFLFSFVCAKLFLEELGS